jgi:hypothetical protein
MTRLCVATGVLALACARDAPVAGGTDAREGAVVAAPDLCFESLLADRAYEFLFVFTPLRFKGATGSPGRPIAIR